MRSQAGDTWTLKYGFLKFTMAHCSEGCVAAVKRVLGKMEGELHEADGEGSNRSGGTDCSTGMSGSVHSRAYRQREGPHCLHDPACWAPLHVLTVSACTVCCRCREL